MRLDWFDRLPVNIPTLLLILAAGLLVVRIVVSRVGVLRSTWRRSIVETLDASVFAAVLSLIIITFVVQAFYIPSGSMEPTLQIGDRILVSKFSYRLGTIRRGDITVFHFPLSPSRDFVKRVVALPGETVELREGLVLINGKPLSELYPTPLPGGDRACTSSYGPKKVPEGQYFVLGDNRCNSEDSRFFGFVPAQNVVGKALLVYWPLPRVGLVR
ncbi:MAG: signal peptidase I, signal peptidase I [Armatimonadetes bacterium CSP1-3]|nr:MAG: signal peptidase I, signal peptidase I [Armatimonadetes bacterium CSP1-3]